MSRTAHEQALWDCLRRPLAFDEARLAQLGLKRREGEVMHWVAVGLTDKAVAALPGLIDEQSLFALYRSGRMRLAQRRANAAAAHK